MKSKYSKPSWRAYRQSDAELGEIEMTVNERLKSPPGGFRGKKLKDQGFM
jgi:hypothetical protein